MTRFTLLAVLFASAGLQAWGSVDSGLLALVPSDAKVVTGLDFDRARTSDFGRFLTARMNATASPLAQFTEETGFDPRRDLQQVVFATSGRDASGRSSLAIIARGNFDEARIKAAATKIGIRSQAFQGVDLFSEKVPNNGPDAFAFLGSGIGVMGNVETVKKIIATRGTGPFLDTEMQTEISKVGAGNDLWFVSFLSGGALANQIGAIQSANGPADEPQPDGPKPAPNTPPSQMKALTSIVHAQGGIQFGSAVQVTFDAITRSAKDATSLADVVRFFASMVQMQRQKDPRAEVAASALDNMSLSATGDNVHLAVSMPEKSLEELIDESSPAPASSHRHRHAQ